MANNQHTQQAERIEQRALERDLVSELSPDKKTRQKARYKAAKLRELLEWINRRKREEG